MTTKFDIGDKACVRVKIKEIRINSKGEVIYDTYIDGKLGTYEFREDELHEEIQDKSSSDRVREDGDEL